jgi:hypothetical protein
MVDLVDQSALLLTKYLEAQLRGRKTLPLGRTPRRSSGGRKGGSRDDPIDEELGGDCKRVLVGGGRDLGGARGTQHLMGSCTRMANGVRVFALWVFRAISRFETAY